MTPEEYKKLSPREQLRVRLSDLYFKTNKATWEQIYTKTRECE